MLMLYVRESKNAHLMSCHPSPTLPMSGLKLMREIPSDLKVGVAGGLSTVVNGAILQL